MSGLWCSVRLARTYCAGSTGRSAGRVNTRVQERKSVKTQERKSARKASWKKRGDKCGGEM